MTELSKIELDGTEDDVAFDAAELGAMMREMRQAMQRDLKDVAQELRIRRQYLEAIEDGRLDDLPGPAYTTGFLRAYSDYLGLDGEDIVNRFKQAGIDIDRRTNLILPSPLEEGRLPTGSVLLFAALFAVIAYAGWYYVSTGDEKVVEQVAQIPTEFEPLSKVSQPKSSDLPLGALSPGGAPVQVVGTESSAVPSSESSTVAETQPDAAAAAPQAEKPATVAAAAAPARAETSETRDAPVTRSETETQIAAAEPAPAQPAAEPAPAQPAKPPEKAKEPPPAEVETVAAAPDPSRRENRPENASGGGTEVAEIQPQNESAPASGAASEIAPAVTSETLANAKIIIRATEDSWVEIRVGRQKPLLSRLMRVGESFEMASRPGLKMVTGNAGGVAIEVNGTQVPPLGAAGQILQDVSIDAKALMDRVPANP